MSEKIIDLKNRASANSKIGEQHAQRLAAIVESSDDAIVSKDLNGSVVTWNKAAERIFGYAAEEVAGKSITILIPPDRENEEAMILDRIRRGERIEHYDTVRRRKDGTLIDVSLTVSPIRDEKGRIVGASKIARDVTERKRQEAFIALLSREVDHRAKNLLAVVQAMVSLTEGDSPAEVKAAIMGRIQALAHAHNLLALSHWEGASLETIIKHELAPYLTEDNTRAMITGTNQTMGTRGAQSIAIVMHELATNAVKYGAFSVPSGRVCIEWSVAPDRGLHLRWTETDGPAISSPPRSGFGTRAINMMIKNQLGGTVAFDWRNSGLVCDIIIPMEQLSKSD